MRKFLLLLLLAPLSAMAAQWHNLTDGSYCLQLDTSQGDIWCADADSFDYTLAAGDKLLIDAATTAHTQTAGALDINFATVTSLASALNISATQNNGTSAAVNSYLGSLTMTQNDADGDLDGILITAAATANAAAGSYEYAIAYDFAENTAGACLDGLLITSTGVDAGLTDAIDVSASNIANAISIGSNLVLGDNSDSLTVGATDNALTLTASTTATATFVGADAAGAANTTLDTTGAGAIIIGSGDVTSVTITADGTADVDLVLPDSSVSGTEITNATLLPADDLYPHRGTFTVCGDLVTISNNTVYYGPSQAVVASATVGLARTCNTSAAGNTTEATADEPAYTATAFQVAGLDCLVTDPGATITFTTRSAGAGTTPSIVASIADNVTQGTGTGGPTTTAIASGATFAIAAASTADVGTIPFICTVSVIY